jgi:hypothetical protein
MGAISSDQRNTASVDGRTFYLDLNIVDRILWKLKLINLDFRKEEFQDKSNRDKLYSQILAAVMIIININFVVFEVYNFETNDRYDDDWRDDYRYADDQHSKRKHVYHRNHKEHFFEPTIAANIAASALAISLYMVIPRTGRFNQTFIINVLRSQMIMCIQLLFQIVYAPSLYTAEKFYSFYLLCVQVLVETSIFFSYLRVWTKVKDDPHDYRYISLDRAPTPRKSELSAGDMELVAYHQKR